MLMSPSRRLLLALVTVLSVVGVSLVVMPPAAQAAVPLQYGGSAGGTFVRALGGAVRSDLTSASAINGTTYPNAMVNTLAHADVLNGLANVGAIDTSMAATNPGGVTVLAGSARTASVSLLGGAITVEAVETEIVAHHDGAADMDGEANSTFVGLKIGNANIPIDVPRGFGITIPGVASVTLNDSKTTVVGGELTVSGAAITVTLLGAYGESPIGTTIEVNPVDVSIKPFIPTTATPVTGFAYGTFVAVGAPPLLRTISGATAAVGMPAGGTAGYPLTNSTAAVDLPRIASVGAVESVCKATSVPVTLDATCSNEVARLNLLNGLIKADAVTAVAHLTKDAGGVITTDPSSVIADLRVLGIPIKLQAGATTTISIPGVLTITLNRQQVTGNSVTVTAVRVVLGVPLLGLPAGAIIEVAKANVGTP
jgi:hypothetical protein